MAGALATALNAVVNAAMIGTMFLAVTTPMATAI